jgi:chitinase
MPLAAHATNREQQLPAGFTGHTAKSHSSPAIASTAAPEQAPVTAAPKRHGSKAVEHNAQAEAHASSKKKPETAAVAHKESKKAATTASARKDSKNTIASAGHDGKKTKGAANQINNSVVSRAMDAVGTPYRWGGTNPKKGLDCSGLVKYAFNGVKGANLPRTSNAMAAGHGQKVDRKDLKPGDLLFFNIESRKVDHVAIYLGNDRFVHAPSRGKSVTVDTLKKPYWDSHYVVAKRVTTPQKTASMRIVQR